VAYPELTIVNSSFLAIKEEKRPNEALQKSLIRGLNNYKLLTIKNLTFV
jgi:hypothetical protein